MSGVKTSVLAQKIARAKRAAPASSDIAEFVSAFGKALEETIGELLGAPTEAKIAHGEAKLPEAIENAASPGVYYWLTGERGSLCALATIAPGFAAAVGERLLGGDLEQPSEDVTPSLLDHQMGGVVVDAISRGVNRVLAKRARSGARGEAISGKRGARSPAEALADIDPMLSLCLTCDLVFGDLRALGAMRIYFSAAYLAGVGAYGATPQRSQEKDAAWARRIRNNILHTEIPLSAVLGRIHTNVGALSRLKIDQVLELESDALNALEISAPTEAGPALIARARLGSYQSNKAIKLTTPIDPAFFIGL